MGLIRKEFFEFSFDDIIFNWGACMGCCLRKEKRSIPWSLPPYEVLKFNVDGALRSKPGPTGIGGVLRNSKGDVVLMFSKHVGVCDSTKAEVLAILKGLRLFSTRYSGALMLESDLQM
eukprot:TRINITY_DN6662_c1_g4_i1.p1 TRINITY_DN6662_c1_g4~~TRINITY_DN6662_c1_g4_i1.p1  ORF type:complete len:118 (-),score=15.06 TRINITY_DN6662_c1_g4_i1:217-570(-)